MSAQRMTEEETQAVIRLWQAEQPGVADTPTLPDVAEGLDMSVEDTHRLLEQVRAQRAKEEKLLEREQAEAELECIQLAEEERKLAEVRRQRVRLQPITASTMPPNLGLGFWSAVCLITVAVAVLGMLCLIVASVKN